MNLTSDNMDELNYVIVGAGPTGTELAGSMGKYLKKIAKKHKMDRSNMKVFLVEAGPRILPQLSNRASRLAAKRLANSDVIILTDTKVESESINNLKTSMGTIKTNNVIWTAGTKNNPFFFNPQNKIKLNDKGRVIVDKYLSIDKNIYVCGDNAATPHSGLAYTAVHHANFIALDIKRRNKGRRRRAYSEPKPVQVVPVDNNFSVLQYGNFTLHGRIISIVRRIADFIGYKDVLGSFKALTIWSGTEHTEEQCRICKI